MNQFLIYFPKNRSSQAIGKEDTQRGKKNSKDYGWRRQEWRPPPSNLGVGKAYNSGCHVEGSTRGERGHWPMQTVGEQVDQRRQVWCHLPQHAWRGEGVQQWLKCGMLYRRVGGACPHVNAK
jgi:hypothetical protein